MKIDKAKLDILEQEIVACGKWAVEKQSTLHIQTKSDNTPVTEVDLGISTRLLSLIKELFPEAAIITEEEITEDKEDAPYTFVLDPIDGTDVFSQGLPSFCIALGILNTAFEPVGSIVYAPRFGVGTPEGMLLRLDPEGELLLNGQKHEMQGDKDCVKQICMSSKTAKWFDFSSFDGKCRIFGSNILHVLSPVVFRNISGAVNERCYIWDYAAAYAILKWAGMTIENTDGSTFVFDESMRKRNKCAFYNYAGTQKAIAQMKKEIRYKG